MIKELPGSVGKFGFSSGDWKYSTIFGSVYAAFAAALSGDGSFDFQQCRTEQIKGSGDGDF